MNTSIMVHYAVACLEELDAPRAPRELSLTKKMPLKDCLQILRRLESAGMIRENACGQVERTCMLDDITALQVLQALLPSKPEVQLLYKQNGLHADQVSQQLVPSAAWPRG